MTCARDGSAPIIVGIAPAVVCIMGACTLASPVAATPARCFAPGPRDHVLQRLAESNAAFAERLERRVFFSGAAGSIHGLAGCVLDLCLPRALDLGRHRVG